MEPQARRCRWGGESPGVFLFVAANFQGGMAMEDKLAVERRSDAQRERDVSGARKPYKTPVIAKGPVLSAITATDTHVSGVPADE